MVYRQDFNKDLKRGKIGEDFVKEVFAARGWYIVDVSNNKEYQNKDIDFLATKEGECRKCEVKSDTWIHSSHNVLLELENETRRTKGWFRFTEADALVVHAAATDDIYSFKISELREYVELYGSGCRKVRNNDYLSNGEYNTYVSLLVNIYDYSDKGYSVQVIRKEVEGK